jgi:hypothetical protein
MAAVLGLIAAIAAALIARSVTISNHRQAWINGLRDELAAFFTAIDVLHFKMGNLSHGGDVTTLEEQQKARNDVLLAYRRILMRLNINEPLHQGLEKSLGHLLTTTSSNVNQSELSEAITLARTILKREWEVTKYGLLSRPAIYLKTRWRLRKVLK